MALEIASKTRSAAASRNPRAAITATPDLIKFATTSEGLSVVQNRRMLYLGTKKDSLFLDIDIDADIDVDIDVYVTLDIIPHLILDITPHLKLDIALIFSIYIYIYINNIINIKFIIKTKHY